MREETRTQLNGRFGAETFSASQFRDNDRLTCPRDQLGAVCSFLRNECGFDMLVDLTAVDYLEYRGARDRFGVIYTLLATERGERLFLKAMVNEPDLSLPSVTPLWRGADWMEREVFDMFGIQFVGHSDLRRILLPEQFVSFPLRKDYPLHGRGERHNFQRILRHEG